MLAAHTFDEDTELVGHSGGAGLLLALREHLDVTVAQAVLAADYRTLPNDGPEPVLQDAYGWEAIRSHAGEMVLLNSVIDEFGCDAE